MATPFQFLTPIDIMSYKCYCLPGKSFSDADDSSEQRFLYLVGHGDVAGSCVNIAVQREKQGSEVAEHVDRWNGVLLR